MHVEFILSCMKFYRNYIFFFYEYFFMNTLFMNNYLTFSKKEIYFNMEILTYCISHLQLQLSVCSIV